MSTSTVSIRANPSTRRRPALSTDRKSTAATSVELLGLDHHTNSDSNHAHEIGEYVSNITGRDLRASSLLLDRPKDAIHVKEILPNDAVSPRRTKKVFKPLWQTAFSVFFKNFMLLIVVLGFVQFIYRFAVKSGSGGPSVGVDVDDGAVVDLEGRLVEMENRWKRTAMMMQVQVEVVDVKLGNEITGLRRELSKIIEETSVVLENQLLKIDAKVDNFESTWGQLSLDEFLTKEEFNKFIENLKNVGGGNKEISLDDVRAYAREVVETEIQKHAADGLNTVDYALAAAGGMVVKHSEPFTAEKWSWLKRKLSRSEAHQDGEKMLQPNFGEPGQCFPLRGTSGFVQVMLRTAIIPEAFTLEHVAKSVAYDRSSAPRDCRVSGWLQSPKVDSQVETEAMFLLSEFTYDLDKSYAQTFPVSDSASVGVVNMIRFDFNSNHGSPSHTCIYRLRVHGQEPDSISMMELQS